MNNRRKRVIALGAGTLAAPLASFAQQQGKVWRVAYPSLEQRAKDNVTIALIRVVEQA